MPPRAHGSIATWTYQVARRFARDHDVVAIEFGDRSLSFWRERHEGVTYAYVPALPNRLANTIHHRLSSVWRRRWAGANRVERPAYASNLHNLAFAVQAARLARRWRADVIHIHNFTQLVPVVRFFNPSARIVLLMNCEWLSQHDARMVAPRVEAADVVAGCSRHVVGRFLARFPWLEPKAAVLHNGAEVEHFVPCVESVTAEPPLPLRILFVGRISPEKGVHLLADAFAKVAERFPTATLEIVGGAGSLAPEFLVALSEDPGVQGLKVFYGRDYVADIRQRIPDAFRHRVTFHGSLSHAELAAHYAQATIFVSASLSDAFPLTVLEAMAAGLPIVASAVGGVPEAVADGVTGVLVAPNNGDALAGGICRLLEDVALRRRMAEAARVRAVERFAWSVIAADAARVYRLSAPDATPASVA